VCVCVVKSTLLALGTLPDKPIVSWVGVFSRLAVLVGWMADLMLLGFSPLLLLVFFFSLYSFSLGVLNSNVCLF
jgi:hypothetical protein